MYTHFWKHGKARRPSDHIKKGRSKLLWEGRVQFNNRILTGFSNGASQEGRKKYNRLVKQNKEGSRM